MTTTMDGMSEIIRLLAQQNRRDAFRVLIGGGPISQAYADSIGADAYAVNAADAVRKVRSMLSEVSENAS